MTKLYLTNNNFTGITDNVAGWTLTGNADKKLLSASKINSSFVSKIFSETTNILNCSVLNRRYVSPPLSGTHVFTGTVKAQIWGLSDYIDANFHPKSRVILYNESGTAVKSLNNYFPLSGQVQAYSTSGTNLPIPSTSGISLATGFTNWRIGFDVGVIAYNTTDLARSGYQEFGCLISGSDLPENNPTGSGNPWLEFSMSINFL